MKPIQNHRLKKVSLLILVLMVVSLMTSLGFWQLRRAQMKQQLIARSAHEAKQKAVLWRVGEPSPRAYQKIKLLGHYDLRYFLLDNQYDHHIWGYHVISPFWIDSQHMVLVDRGWIAGDPLREQFPKIEPIDVKHVLAGEVIYPEPHRWMSQVEPQSLGTHGWLTPDPAVTKMAHCLKHPVLPWLVHLAPDAPFGWIRNWPVVVMGPDQHRGYAVQWFGLATCIACAYVYFLFKSKW